MKNTIFLTAFVVFSCNLNEQSRNECEATYKLLIDENEKYNSYLIENIKKKY